ncbi:UBA/TS-N domain containing protein [Tritrichomonas foetus]|uniref:UBA/TS-N domain containing protein n=1 Tax=Tritrichomonas foetus TaxID=1144522 RepID=A0A1J4KJK4_9EUKA|nr:UBA/TS-N domain containing protein [Tritrichomonas foetus]|eukprot:OHT11395.1 UBA/TS-N domain containing protein [Tritrichomonas foetus]
MNSDEELIIGDDDDDEDTDILSSIELNAGNSLEKLTSTIICCEAYLSLCQPRNDGSTVFFTIPSQFLPLSLQMTCGFHISNIILNCRITLCFNEWNSPPVEMEIYHPSYQQNYVGRPLVLDAVRKFFSQNYKPKINYKAFQYLFKKRGVVDPKKLRTLIEENFKPDQAEDALVACDNNIAQARSFLLTGKSAKAATRINIPELPEYEQCPLIYLILEIYEAFLDLNDHCCICRDKLPFSGIKPTICEKKLCALGFEEIGIGTSVAQEIRRDPLAADFVVSIFSASLQSQYLKPAPPDEILKTALKVLSLLPSMQLIATQCATDKQITQKCGSEALALLRWVLLSNKSQIISLPSHLKIQEISYPFQFMALISSPDAEQEFQERKNKYGSIYMWHGSGGDRWHSIVRNGLLNMSRQPGKQVIHGAAYGEGIYLANSSSYSSTYVQDSPNLYKQSELGSSIHMIAMCEVARMPPNILKDHGSIKTLIDEKACIVRFIFAGHARASYDTISKPLSKVPTLEDVLEYQGCKITGGFSK